MNRPKPGDVVVWGLRSCEVLAVHGDLAWILSPFTKPPTPTTVAIEQLAVPEQ